MRDSASIKSLHKVAARVQALLRKGASLTDAEQLFLENRLMMQIEYHQWARLKHKRTTEGTNHTEEAFEPSGTFDRTVYFSSNRDRDQRGHHKLGGIGPAQRT